MTVQNHQTEEDIPALADQAVRQVVASAIAEGRSVLVQQDEAVYEVFPDGSRQILVKIIPRLNVEPGTVRTVPQ